MLQVRWLWQSHTSLSLVHSALLSHRCDQGYQGTECHPEAALPSTIMSDFENPSAWESDWQEVIGGQIVKPEEGCGVISSGSSLYFSKVWVRAKSKLSGQWLFQYVTDVMEQSELRRYKCDVVLFFPTWSAFDWNWKLLSCFWLFATPWTIQSMEFSRPEYWSGWPFPSPEDLPNTGIKPTWAFFTSWATRETQYWSG